ncbi:alpha-L-fucosidase [Longispora sp. NPDC051575]|uniref:alpha-L-fucosidase n=1 Tax=Longispora sp. NPDC051575 TaxID=3154943 RepID=UPI0034283165
MRFRSVLALLSALSLSLTLLVAGAPAHAAPGDNHAPDDPFSSARTQWWRTDHFGMFIHFGLYSAYRGEYTRSNGTVCRDAEWIRRTCAIPWNEYEAKAATFNPTGFDANAVVSAAKNGGQKYIVITAKHHDGFAMWPTAVNDWNIHDRSPFQRDILAELATAARAQGVKLGFYYSIWDWHDPDAQPGSAHYQAYLTRMKAQLRELLTNYGDIAELWFDGEWEAPWTAAEGTKLEEYVRGLSPNTIVNNRVGTRRVNDGDFGTPEQEIPATPTDAQLWESCMTINGTWGFAAWDTNFKSSTQLTRNLVGIAASSGNYLLNVGPDERGVIPQTSVDRLRGMGDWLAANGPAVYGAGYTGLVSKPSWGVVSRNGNKLYASVYTWPTGGAALHLSALAPFGVTGAKIRRTGAAVPVTAAGDGFDLRPTGTAPDPIATVIELDITPQAAGPVGAGTGLTARFWANTTFSGTPAVTRVDRGVNYNWREDGSPAPGIPTDNFSGRWTGFVEPRFTEKYTFATLSDDTVKLWVDGRPLVDNTTPHGATVDKGSVTLTAGQRYAITMEHTENGGEATAKLFWSSPNTPQQIVPASQLYPGTVLNDDAPGVAYTGAWSVSSGRTYAADYNADVHYTTTNGDAVSYTFTGTGVDFRTERYSDQGLVDFYLDGVLAATVDTTNPTRLSQQVVYSRRNLAPGAHTLRAVKRSGTYMLVDRIDVFG